MVITVCLSNTIEYMDLCQRGFALFGYSGVNGWAEELAIGEYGSGEGAQI